MNERHRIIREMLSKMPLPAAKEILQKNLPAREFKAIYYADVEQENLNYIADTRLHCSESAVKQYRKHGYEKLSMLYFSKKNYIVN